MSRSRNKRGYPPKRISEYTFSILDHDSRGDKLFTPGRMRTMERINLRKMMLMENPDSIVFRELYRQTGDWDWEELNVFTQEAWIRNELEIDFSSILNYKHKREKFMREISHYKKHGNLDQYEFRWLRIRKIRDIITSADDPLDGLCNVPSHLFEKYINSDFRLRLSK